MLQILKDKNNKHFILECNPRIGGASTFSMQIGLDIIYWSLLEIFSLNNKKIISFNKNDIPIIKQIRVPCDYYELNNNN